MEGERVEQKRVLVYNKKYGSGPWINRFTDGKHVNRQKSFFCLFLISQSDLFFFSAAPKVKQLLTGQFKKRDYIQPLIFICRCV